MVWQWDENTHGLPGPEAVDTVDEDPEPGEMGAVERNRQAGKVDNVLVADLGLRSHRRHDRPAQDGAELLVQGPHLRVGWGAGQPEDELVADVALRVVDT